MKRKIHTAEQIVNKLREADAFMAKGGTLERKKGSGVFFQGDSKIQTGRIKKTFLNRINLRSPQRP